jgi:hypothetical protein
MLLRHLDQGPPSHREGGGGLPGVGEGAVLHSEWWCVVRGGVWWCAVVLVAAAAVLHLHGGGLVDRPLRLHGHGGVSTPFHSGPSLLLKHWRWLLKRCQRT